MAPFHVLALSILLFMTLPLSVGAQDNSKNFTWMIWEQRAVNPKLCRTKNMCKPLSKFITRLIEEPTNEKAQQMLGAIDQLAKIRGTRVEHPDSPKMCQQTEASKILGFNPETWALSDKLAALKDLPGVYFSVRNLKGPADYSGSFGMDLHKTMHKRFKAAGLRVLTEEQMENTPGKPQLNIYFSNANTKTGCTYGLFVSLTQTMLLTRNHTTKLKVGTWGASGGPSTDFPNGNEYDAVIRVVDKLLADYKRANKHKS